MHNGCDKLHKFVKYRKIHVPFNTVMKNGSLTLDDVLKLTYRLGVGVGAGVLQAGEGVSITLALRAHSLSIFCLIAFHIISRCIIALHKLAAVFALIISFSCMPCYLFSSLPDRMYHVNLLHVCPCSDLGDGPQASLYCPH